MALHSFGGNWTEEKLTRLNRYLHAYTTIFHSNERARYLTTHYVDAFAGTGARNEPEQPEGSTLRLLEEQNDATSVSAYYRGSARVALDVQPPFDHFLFIEKKAAHVADLHQLRNEYPLFAERIEVVQGDANEILQRWCRQTNWRSNRAVVFLDPYGMSVDWQTVQALGQTGVGRNGAVDLWVLIPVGQAVNRLLTRDRRPPEAWSDRLTIFFGTDEWIDAFYQTTPKMTLFGEVEEFEKQANFESIGSFFIERLRTAFPYVAENSLVLLNSRKSPLFLLCFAASNRNAVKIANDILRG